MQALLQQPSLRLEEENQVLFYSISTLSGLQMYPNLQNSLNIMLLQFQFAG